MKKGFTLIELLIVVAIIAILAAIAVPNFLEAQVRSKVSRCKSDLRTYSIAIQAYAVDNGRVPVGMTEYGRMYGAPSSFAMAFAAYKFLTTPVAYISSLPTDPFVNEQKTRDTGGGYRTEGNFYYLNCFVHGTTNGWGGDVMMDFLNSKGYTYYQSSVGPSRTEDAPWPEDMLSGGATPLNLTNMYDPTNGTVSHGRIARTNKGELVVPF